MSEETFGEILRRHRVAAGLTQEELADRATLSVRAVSDLERGLKRPRRDTVRLLARALGLSAEETGELENVVSRVRRSDIPESRRQPKPARHNLPAPATAFVGRQAQIRTLAGLLIGDEARLITLTGPGGAGKTRLALRAAVEVLDAFTDGVYFVSLAPVFDSTLVPSTIAMTLGVTEVAGKPLVTALLEYLRDRRILLVLDNFEQVLEAAPMVSSLLSAAPDLTVLITSRTVLHLSGEYEVMVPPLSLPERERLLAFESLTQYEAVALFVQRARAAQLDFELTAGNGPAVAEVCRRVDGLPLAIELAAAHIKQLSPHAILSRLSNRLALLRGGPTDAPARHQTLRATIDWSYDLLTPEEQRLFTRLAVFTGGWTLEPAETVCALRSEAPEDVEGQLTALMDKSLVYLAEPGDGRYSMLETIREYAVERLRERDESQVIEGRHSAHYLDVAERAEPHIQNAHDPTWLRRLDLEYGNIRSVLERAMRSGEVETAVRLAGALAPYWETRSFFTEARRWLDAALSLPGEASSFAQARALLGAGGLTQLQAEYTAATALLQRSLNVYNAIGDPAGAGEVLNRLGLIAWQQGLHQRAASLYADSLARRREAGHTHGIGRTLGNLGALWYSQGNLHRAMEFYGESLSVLEGTGDVRMINVERGNLAAVLMDLGELERAERLFEECVEVYRSFSDGSGEAITLSNLGLLALTRGDLRQARRMHEEALARCRVIEEPAGVARSLYCLGLVALEERKPKGATSFLMDSLTLFHDLGHGLGVGWCLEGLACAMAPEQPDAAVRLFAAVAEMRREQNITLFSLDQTRHDRYLGNARSRVSEAVWERLWMEGCAMSTEAAVEYAESLKA